MNKTKSLFHVYVYFDDGRKKKIGTGTRDECNRIEDDFFNRNSDPNILVGLEPVCKPMRKLSKAESAAIDAVINDAVASTRRATRQSMIGFLSKIQELLN